MSETDLSYVSKSILNVLPGAIDLTKEIKYSSYVTRRDYVEVYPVVQPPLAITSSNLGSATRIVLSDPARWMDKRSAVLEFDLGGLVVPANTFGNVAMLDGPASMIARCNVYVGGQQINGGTVNNLNKVLSAVQLNSGSIASYCSDEANLTGGNERLKCVLQGQDTPTVGSMIQTLCNSPYNFLNGAVKPDGTAVGAGTVAAQVFATDALGFYTIPPDDTTKPATGTAGENYYGYSNVNFTSAGKQTICIPLSTLHPIFDSPEMLPLFLAKEVVLEIFFSSPQQTFYSDLSLVGTASGAGNVAIAGAPQNIVSYSITNMKVCADLVSCSDELNDLYKLKASSSEGLIIAYDDYAISTKSCTYSAGGPQAHQAILSTNNLKSMIFFRQADKVASAQNAWSNSNYMYAGIGNWVSTINNTNIPSNPLSSPNAILAYNMRSRSAIHNQLSNCIANHPYVFGKAETVPTAIGINTTTPAMYLANVPTALTSFMIFNNYEKIHDEEIDVGNGVSLSSAGSMIAVRYNEDQGAGADAKNGEFGAYTMYLLLTYGKALIFADGTVQVRG